jgi:DeoR/GlpR family transcriptional regulator of sugar metabolism
MCSLRSKARFGEIAIKHKFISLDGIVKGLEKQIYDQANGRVSLLGDNIVDLNLISKSQQAHILKDLAMYPRLSYSINTAFGRALSSSILQKQAVGLFVARSHILIKDSANLFLGEGTHTFYLFLALLAENRHASIVTNNLAIASEYTLRPGGIDRLNLISKGIASTQYGALFDIDSDDLDKQLQYSLVFVGSSAIDPSGGPSANGHFDEVQRRSIEISNYLTILCHYHNLCQNPSTLVPILHGSMKEIWRKRLRDSYTWIITTPHPKMPGHELKIRPDKRTPQANTPPHSWQLYSQNSRRLYEEMGDRFVEVKTDSTPVVYK